LLLEIASDNGKKFFNEVVDTLLKLVPIKKTNTTPYHPQKNAQVEFWNKILAAYFKKHRC
jgi:hypothetical protein